MTKQSKTTTIYEVTVPGQEFDRLNRKHQIRFYGAVALTMGASLLSITELDWLFVASLIITSMVLMVATAIVNNIQRHNFLKIHGWDGYSYPLRTVPEYQSFVHD